MQANRQVKTDDKQARVEEIGKAAYTVIAEMVAALQCDYDRMEELRGEEALSSKEEEELKELERAAGECEDFWDAEERVQAHPLSVEVRSGRPVPGEELSPVEFSISVGNSLIA